MEMDGGTQQLEMILGNYQNQAIATMQDFFEKSTGRIVQIDGLVNKEVHAHTIYTYRPFLSALCRE